MKIFELKEINTGKRRTFNFTKEEPQDDHNVIITQYGIYYMQPNENNPNFTDILQFQKIRIINIDYYIDTYTDGIKKYRYQYNRNIYNRHDKPKVVEVEK